MRVCIENDLLTASGNLDMVEQALADWMADHSGRVIYAYQWDGDTYEDDWVSFLDQMADSDAEVNLLTKSEIELKREMKDSVLSYCENVKEQLPTVIQNLFGTRPEMEEGNLGALFEGLQYLISSASLFNLDSDLEDRHDAVVELADAYEAKDFVELADLLKYDWLPWIRQYESSLQKLYVGMS